MKAIALLNRLIRDLDVKAVDELTADGRLEALDAINGALGAMHGVAPEESKTVPGGMVIAAPETITLGVTNGSTEITGRDFTTDEYYRTIRIGSDSIDNQIIGANTLLHAYSGTTGSVTAILYCDAVSIPEPYEQLSGDPEILETGHVLVNAKPRYNRWLPRQVCRPETYQMEANGRNRNSAVPAVMRVDSLPDQAYRLQASFILAPARVTFSDLLSPGADIPLRAELVETYFLPIARGLLAKSSLWKDEDTRSKAETKGDDALAAYGALMPTTLATPRNRAHTPLGF